LEITVALEPNNVSGQKDKDLRWINAAAATGLDLSAIAIGIQRHVLPDLIKGREKARQPLLAADVKDLVLEVAEFQIAEWRGKVIAWETREAVEVLRDTLPRAIQSLAADATIAAANIARVYRVLLAAAEAAHDIGGGVTPGAVKPMRNGKTNDQHRNWNGVFGLIAHALEKKGWTNVGIGEDSPAIVLSLALLEQFGLRVSDFALSTMLKTRRRRKAKGGEYWLDQKMRERKTGTPKAT